MTALPAATGNAQERGSILLTDWEFRSGHDYKSEAGWNQVAIPHDWAIYGPFDRENDLQEVAIYQNGETRATVKTGRSGGLPYMGKGCYRRSLDIPMDMISDGQRNILLFDGAMSEARVVVNDSTVCFWPYGYNSFWCDITDVLHEGRNSLAVLLENRPQSSRWYPGAGLYRKVRLLTVPAVHIPVWGTYITTPYVGEDYASIRLLTEIDGVPDDAIIRIRTVIRDADGNERAVKDDIRRLSHGISAEQHLTVENPHLWSPETPYLYTAETSIYYDASVQGNTDVNTVRKVLSEMQSSDTYVTRFGIRSVELRAERGFFLNGTLRKFKGVCLHHDLGPLGAAVNKSAIRHQLEMLKDMGCDAIRTSHNMPAEELVELCDEMGLMVMVEPFDEWNEPKCENGYHRFFNEWAEKDMVNMLRHFRNNPSVVMWSIGNEIPTQWTDDGYRTAAWLLEICRREDPTRPVTCGMDQFDAVVNNGFAGLLDVAGFNYKPSRYPEAYSKLPQNLILGSETASTVSSRGVYHFPAVAGYDRLHDDHQSSSYDTEYCSWSNMPDLDLAADEDFEWCIGQFVWTGFDYLGEPSPYDTDAWPNHSSLFGIIDLASIPKDRYWLYRSVWNSKEPTLHILPHWNWNGREGEKTPVYVYTSWPAAELFVNGISQGRKEKKSTEDAYMPDLLAEARNDGQGYGWNEKDEIGMELAGRFRLMWEDVEYEPGEIKVIAYDENGNAADEKTVRTAGKPYALKLTINEAESGKMCLPADGETLAYINVSVTDKEGNPVPIDDRLVRISVRGAGKFKALANGDPTCLEPFHIPQMHLFGGQLTAIVQNNGNPGEIIVEASAKGLKKCTLALPVKAVDSAD